MSTSSAMADWNNGSLQGSQFVWSNGGGDPYRGSLDQALSLAGISDAKLRRTLSAVVNANPRGNAPRHTIQNGDKLGVMISGSGWVARNSVAQTSSWRSGRSRQASVWYYNHPKLGQIRLIRADVCGNWIIWFSRVAEKCRCDKTAGDAC